ncbi:hypothetical protein LTR10_017762 [Elasticomyces elasticus]|uniref:Uncharacterized protein n=1 Tax=Exophiala sideris TaxID=1016849 RepID=A0ABR0JC42_9EURO|nr:hypothetical protein LTR10_017762 [Elasticomyces elasticus]KAK5031270.1 hypothetical protein LTS07_005005 [Exophiala sideris]KAK5038990.1 hypothetical protein LTR13_004021 [Exophiala sideris]KAK5060875.1 hypothetical protein LTR69_005474 [Exophiala sideris]KAK5183786.1 hypothetical protein LTR44_004068 [Eurotiomycetes sp. CCFEE 6388]
MKLFHLLLTTVLAMLFLATLNNAAPTQDSAEVDATADDFSGNLNTFNDSSNSIQPTKWAWVVFCLTDDRTFLTRCSNIPKRANGTSDELIEDDGPINTQVQPRDDTQEDSTNYYNLYTSQCRSICSCADNGDFTCSLYGSCNPASVWQNCIEVGQCQCAFKEVLAGSTAQLGSYNLNGNSAVNGGYSSNWVRDVDKQEPGEDTHQVIRQASNEI